MPGGRHQLLGHELLSVPHHLAGSREETEAGKGWREGKRSSRQARGWDFPRLPGFGHGAEAIGQQELEAGGQGTVVLPPLLCTPAARGRISPFQEPPSRRLWTTLIFISPQSKAAYTCWEEPWVRPGEMKPYKTPAPRHSPSGHPGTPSAPQTQALPRRPPRSSGCSPAVGAPCVPPRSCRGPHLGS